MTVSRLAKRLGLHRSTIARWEDGQSLPELDMLAAASELLDIDMRYLVTGQHSMGLNVAPAHLKFFTELYTRYRSDDEFMAFINAAMRDLPAKAIRIYNELWDVLSEENDRRRQVEIDPELDE